MTSMRRLTTLLDPKEIAALRWLPQDGTPRNRGSRATHRDRPGGAVMERLSNWTGGDPRREICLHVCLCEHVGALDRVDRPMEFDEHWRLTPAGMLLVQACASHRYVLRRDPRTGDWSLFAPRPDDATTAWERIPVLARGGAERVDGGWSRPDDADYDRARTEMDLSVAMGLTE